MYIIYTLYVLNYILYGSKPYTIYDIKPYTIYDAKPFYLICLFTKKKIEFLNILYIYIIYKYIPNMVDISHIDQSVYQDYLCPISYMIMKNPVNINDNHRITFELQALNMWGKNMCPMTRQPIKNIKTNFKMINEINKLLEQYPELKTIQFNYCSFFDLIEDIVDTKLIYDFNEIQNNIHCFHFLVNNNFVNHVKYYIDNIHDLTANYEFLNLFAKIPNINDDIFYYFTNAFCNNNNKLEWLLNNAFNTNNINMCYKILNLPNINNILLLNNNANLNSLYIKICNTNNLDFIDKYLDITKINIDRNPYYSSFFDNFLTFSHHVQYLLIQKFYHEIINTETNVFIFSSIIYEFNKLVLNGSINFNNRLKLMETINIFNIKLEQKISYDRQILEEKRMMEKNRPIITLPGFK